MILPTNILRATSYKQLETQYIMKEDQAQLGSEIEANQDRQLIMKTSKFHSMKITKL